MTSLTGWSLAMVRLLAELGLVADETWCSYYEDAAHLAILEDER